MIEWSANKGYIHQYIHQQLPSLSNLTWQFSIVYFVILFVRTRWEDNNNQYVIIDLSYYLLSSSTNVILTLFNIFVVMEALCTVNMYCCLGCGIWSLVIYIVTHPMAWLTVNTKSLLAGVRYMRSVAWNNDKKSIRYQHQRNDIRNQIKKAVILLGLLINMNLINR